MVDESMKITPAPTDIVSARGRGFANLEGNNTSVAQALEVSSDLMIWRPSEITKTQNAAIIAYTVKSVQEED